MSAQFTNDCTLLTRGHEPTPAQRNVGTINARTERESPHRKMLFDGTVFHPFHVGSSELQFIVIATKNYTFAHWFVGEAS